MSHENLIRERMMKLDVTADFLASFSGVPGTRLSQAFRGVRALDNAQIVTLTKALEELEALSRSVSPVPVAFRNARTIRNILDEQRNGHLRIDVQAVPR